MLVAPSLDTVNRPVVEAEGRVQTVELFHDEVVGLAAVAGEEQRIPWPRARARECVCVCVCEWKTVMANGGLHEF